jgi:hypothetical protein
VSTSIHYTLYSCCTRTVLILPLTAAGTQGGDALYTVLIHYGSLYTLQGGDALYTVLMLYSTYYTLYREAMHWMYLYYLYTHTLYSLYREAMHYTLYSCCTYYTPYREAMHYTLYSYTMDPSIHHTGRRCTGWTEKAHWRRRCGYTQRIYALCTH